MNLNIFNRKSDFNMEENMEKSITIYYNPEKGYVFCAETYTLPRKMRTNAKPAILLSAEDASEENLGKYIRETLKLAQNAEPIDLEKDGIYQYWKDAGYKNNGQFTKVHTCTRFEEKEGKYYFDNWVYSKQGCYVATRSMSEIESVSNTISNKELGYIIIKTINSITGKAFKNYTKYIWDGSSWINSQI